MKEEIIKFIHNDLLGGKNEVEIDADDDLLSAGYVESMGMMQLINFVEERYDVKVTPQEMTIENFMTVNAIVEFIHRSK